ncbi:DedA family protein [Salinivibrio proteolyticus]|nr:DedA family protein [Salinivibrio proteolyticus]OOF25220.1 DedA family protein [Salinivibrio proteolyticus]
MDALSVFSALWHHDLAALQHMDLSLLYVCVGLLVFAESGFLPAAPLPCDSVIVLCGSLAAFGVFNLYVIILILIMAGWLGSAMAFYQGQRLKEWRWVSHWLNKVPAKHLQRADTLIGRYGLHAMFVARFLPVVRSLLPMMIGLRQGLSLPRFLVTSLCNAVFWICLLVLSGYAISYLPPKLAGIVNHFLIIAPLMTLVIASLSLLVGWLFHRRTRKRRSPLTTEHETFIE